MAKEKKNGTGDQSHDQSQDQAPNVRLAAEAKALGKGPINMGMETIGELPDEETQRAGFYFADPQQLVRMFPERYKLLTEKGK